MDQFVSKYKVLSQGTNADTLLFLYRDIGLFWETVLSKRTDISSLKKNKDLSSFINSGRIIYNITNVVKIEKISKNIDNNTFYYTDTASSHIGGLVKHLRNSIMHGEFEAIGGTRNGFYFRDYYKNKLNMIGKVEYPILKDFITILHDQM